MTDDLANFLDRSNRQYDIVSCFSVLHHYALGKGQMPAEEFIRKLDAMTGSVRMLGTDQDGQGRYQGQYGRHLFACYRS